MQGKTLLIRADASAEIGVGHVMRCIALAEAWQQAGGRAFFALAQGATELETRIRSHGGEVVRIKGGPGSREDAASTVEFNARCGADWVVLDGYQFRSDYIREIEAVASRLLVIADGGQSFDFDCDLVVNPEPGALEDAYQAGTHRGEVLLGPRYALLRREFLRFALERRTVPQIARNILITFGGGDLHNVTLQVLRAFEEITESNLELTVVAGPSNQHKASLEVAAGSSHHAVNLFSNVENMPEFMSQTDLAIAAGGGTCYELAFMRVPMVLITIAKNQERAVEAYVSANAAISAGAFQSLNRVRLADMIREAISNPALRSKLEEHGGRMVDGKGAERIVEKMLAVDGREMGRTS
jgi:UDP-2,4-diacetamido-2,4,6-trideoxy-beta-L-altropyranose hydrolase